jgi:hypothetical protein
MCHLRGRRGLEAADYKTIPARCNFNTARGTSEHKADVRRIGPCSNSRRPMVPELENGFKFGLLPRAVTTNELLLLMSET